MKCKICNFMHCDVKNRYKIILNHIRNANDYEHNEAKEDCLSFLDLIEKTDGS